MATVRQNYNRGKSYSEMLKYIVAILPEKIQWFWDALLASQIGGYATSSSMNGSVATSKSTLDSDILRRVNATACGLKRDGLTSQDLLSLDQPEQMPLLCEY